jgi:hypothetical protein
MSSSPHQVPRCQANRPLVLLVVLAGGAGAGAPRPHAAASTFTPGARRTDTAGREHRLRGHPLLHVDRSGELDLHIDNASYSDQRVGVPDR